MYGSKFWFMQCARIVRERLKKALSHPRLRRGALSRGERGKDGAFYRMGGDCATGGEDADYRTGTDGGGHGLGRFYRPLTWG